MNINWVIIYSLDSFVSTLIDISKIFIHYYTHVFYTSFLESQHYIQLSMLRWYESIGLPHDSVHTFHCSQFQRIPCHILWIKVIFVELHILTIVIFVKWNNYKPLNNKQNHNIWFQISLPNLIYIYITYLLNHTYPN